MLLVVYGPTSGNFDFVAYDSAGAVWDGEAYVSPPAGGTDPTAYRIAATQGPSGRYTGTAPAGAVWCDLRLRASTWDESTVIWEQTLYLAVILAALVALPAAVWDYESGRTVNSLDALPAGSVAAIQSGLATASALAAVAGAVDALEPAATVDENVEISEVDVTISP